MNSLTDEPTIQTSKGMPLLDAEVLRTFLTIVETRSFRRTADLVYRTPSAVSMQIQRLESQLGRVLFSREGRKVEVTPDGETLAVYARQMLNINEQALAHFLAPPVEGRVRIGAPDDFGAGFLPQILRRFASTHPSVEVDVTLAPSRELIKRQDRGNLDLILVTPHQDQPPSDFAQIVHSEPLVWVGLQGGTAPARQPVPLALASPGCAWRAVATGSLDQIDRRYRIAYTSELSQGQLAAILADLAVAALPISRVAPPLRQLSKEEGFPTLPDYNILLRRHPDIGEAASSLAEHVVAQFKAWRGL